MAAWGSIIYEECKVKDHYYHECIIIHCNVFECTNGTIIFMVDVYIGAHPIDSAFRNEVNFEVI